MIVTKHDGRKEQFDYHKIENAVDKAVKATEGKQNPYLGNIIAKLVTDVFADKDCTVDDIHNEVERQLMKDNPDVAKNYILYRQQRTEKRLGNTALVKGIKTLLQEASKDNANSENSMASKAHFIAEHVLKETELLSDSINPKYAKNHREGRIYIHDLSYRHMSVNCFFSPLGKMLKEGFDNGTGYVRPPKHITTAGALASIILQSQQANYYGGQGYVHWDTDLAPYAQAEYERQKKQIEEGLIAVGYETTSKEEIDKLAMRRTEDAVFQAMQAFVYNANTQKARSGGQNVFSSVNFGTDTSFWGRMISEMTLKAFIEGMGHGEMPFFPVMCFRIKKGINLYPNDPNFDLTMLALECVGKRIMPRFVLADSDMYTDKKNASRMGCADGQEIIQYKVDNEYYCEGISRLWDRFKNQAKSNGTSEYVKPDNVKILDGDKYVDVKTIVKNPNDDNWCRVNFENGRSVTVTADHPFYTKDRGRVLTKDLEESDEIKSFWNTKIPQYVKVKSVEILPFKNDDSFDVETETDHFNLSFVMSGNCRTNVSDNINGDNSPEARGNLSFNTINLPYIALEAKNMTGNTLKYNFFKLLDEAIDDCIGELSDRYKVMCTFKAKDFPFASKWYQGHENLKSPDDSMETCFKNGSLSVGYVGLAECLIALTGKHHGESKEAQELGLEIVGRIRKATDKQKEKTHLNWSTFSTPAENCSHVLMQKTKKRFGIIQGVTDHDYLTNSCHIPVWAGVDAKTKIDIEGKYHLLANGGSIFYLETGQSPKYNPEGLLAILQYAAEKKEIGYMGFNFAMNFCKECHFKWDGDGVQCPKCGSSNLQRVAIVTGYLADLNRMNDGKKAEVSDREPNL